MRNWRILLLLVLFLGLWNFVLNFDINHTGFAIVEDDATNPNDDFRPYIGIAVIGLFIYLNWKQKQKKDAELETEIYKKPEDQVASKQTPTDDGEPSKSKESEDKKTNEDESDSDELSDEEKAEIEKEAREELEQEKAAKKSSKSKAIEAAKKKIKAEMKKQNKEDQE